MKKVIILLLLFTSLTASAVDYVTVTNNCPVISFASNGLGKLSVYKSNLKVQKTDTQVVVTIISPDAGTQTITWNASQANAYGGKTLSTLYTYILTIIISPC